MYQHKGKFSVFSFYQRSRKKCYQCERCGFTEWATSLREAEKLHKEYVQKEIERGKGN